MNFKRKRSPPKFRRRSTDTLSVPKWVRGREGFLRQLAWKPVGEWRCPTSALFCLAGLLGVPWCARPAWNVPSTWPRLRAGRASKNARCYDGRAYPCRRQGGSKQTWDSFPLRQATMVNEPLELRLGPCRWISTAKKPRSIQNAGDRISGTTRLRGESR